MVKDTTGNVKVTLIKSTIGKKASHKSTVIGLGLRKINHTVELKDTPEIRGMIKSINYLLKVEN